MSKRSVFNAPSLASVQKSLSGPPSISEQSILPANLVAFSIPLTFMLPIIRISSWSKEAIELTAILVIFPAVLFVMKSWSFANWESANKLLLYPAALVI